MLCIMMLVKAVHLTSQGYLLVDKCRHSLLLSQMAKENPTKLTLLAQTKELDWSLLSWRDNARK